MLPVKLYRSEMTSPASTKVARAEALLDRRALEDEKLRAMLAELETSRSEIDAKIAQIRQALGERTTEAPRRTEATASEEQTPQGPTVRCANCFEIVYVTDPPQK